MGSGRSSDGERARLLIISLAALFVFLFVGGISAAAYELTQSSDDATSVQTLEPQVLLTAAPRTASPSPVPTASPVPTPFFASGEFHIAIDKLGVDAPVVTEGMDSSGVPIVPLNSYEVAWYKFTSAPGTPGNVVFAGHKTWGGEAVFYDLDQLQPGDVIRLTGDDGGELRYTVTDSFTVREDDPNAVSVMFPTTSDVMTIITCDGTRYYTGDPVFGHDYTERRVIRAIPSGVTPPVAG